MTYPAHRGRRLRDSESRRRMNRETILTPDNLILPLFVLHGNNWAREIPSMPGVFQYSVDRLGETAEQAVNWGIPAVLLFGLPESKADDASPAWDECGPVPTAIRFLKANFPDLTVITDVCLCAYSTHGHCGLVDANGYILNDESLLPLSHMALAHAAAGADFVAPSDMMDGRVGYLRSALDREGFSATGILSYAVKYASAFYGPFRDAADSAPAFGDRRSHQMDPANAREAIREAKADVEEGADMVMVKPALSYLDIIRRVRDEVNVPVVCYNVSGEYSMIKAAAEKGWLDERKAVSEALLSMRRAGADCIITYYALDAAWWWLEQHQ